MRKALLAGAIVLGLLGTQQVQAKRVDGAPNLGASVALSMMFPGAGEWYNSEFNYGFPWWECIAGYICPCVRFASAFDAAWGRKAANVRINFWSAPNE